MYIALGASQGFFHAKSTSDLADLRETLSDRVRDTETLLVQQSRINTELQEGLMKTRMIPLASMVPRLRRIVRRGEEYRQGFEEKSPHHSREHRTARHLALGKLSLTNPVKACSCYD